MPRLGRGLAHLGDPVGDDAQRVDVEAGVGLVEDRDVGFEERHLEDLVALLLATREALVEVALREPLVHAELRGPFEQRHAHLEHRQVGDALARRHRLAQEVEDAHARDLLGVLEAEEQAARGALVGGERRDVVAAEDDRPGVTSYAGSPRSVLARVDLPDPFGPMSVWTSPAPTERDTPRRISAPSTVTCRSRISSAGAVLMGSL